MKLKTILLILNLLICTSASAVELTNKEKALKVVENYALATACHTTFEKTEDNNFGTPNTENIYVSYTTIDNVYLGMNKYLILWGGYDGCSIAATGQNYTYNLTEIEYSEFANRYVITSANIIGQVKDEPFFSLANISSFKEIDMDTYELYLYMFNSKDLDHKTDTLKESAKAGYYRILLTRDSQSDIDNAFKVIEKNRIGE